jgi:flagellar basal body-associated protein FliL
MVMKSKIGTIICLVLIGLMITVVVLFYQNRGRVELPSMLRHPSQKNANDVRCVLRSTLGAQTLRLTFHVPCRDREHKRELSKNLPRIHHDLVMTMDRQEISHSLKKRDFEEVRSHLLTIVNKHTTRPVDKLYFDNFSLD